MQVGRKLGRQLRRGRQTCAQKAVGSRQVDRQAGWQADHVVRQVGGCAVGQVDMQMGTQASFEPAEGRLQKLVFRIHD